MKIRFRSFARDQLLKASHKLRCPWPPINTEPEHTVGGFARKKRMKSIISCVLLKCAAHIVQMRKCAIRVHVKQGGASCTKLVLTIALNQFINLIIRLHLSLRKCAKMRREIRNTWWCLLKVYFTQFHICVLIVLSVWVSDWNTVITF